MVQEIINAWKERGTIKEYKGIPIFYIEEGEGPNLVCFHGFPSNSWDWHKLLPLLTSKYRILIFDFPGYGLSGKPTDYSYSLLDQMNIVEELLLTQGFNEFHLLAHDMGLSVACELFYRLENQETLLKVNKTIFLNGSVYVKLQKPLITQKILNHPLVGPVLARFSNRHLFRQQFSKVFTRELSEEERTIYWEFLSANKGKKVLAKLARYRKERFLRAERWTKPLTKLSSPFLILWGEEDPIAVVDIAHKLHQSVPGSILKVLPGVGHYPQIEGPEKVAEEIRAFLA